jgi:hypothetical protein
LGGFDSTVISSSAGVKFSEGAHPADLPGYDVGSATRIFSADSDAPIKPNGVDNSIALPEEYLEILFGLKTGKYFENVIADLRTGELVIGVKVQGFANGQSEGFITPVPGAVFLGALGMSVAGWRLRRFA